MGRKKYGRELKARIAFDSIKVQKTIEELTSDAKGQFLIAFLLCPNLSIRNFVPNSHSSFMQQS